MYDLIIRDGMVYDGTGQPPMAADVAVKGDLVAAVGEINEALISGDTVVIDAAGHIVTPGFVDAHTHYDGQVTWDPFVTPSTFHGVTTIVTGNCGVGFAPCRPDQRDWLIGLMEGVEDIPGTALHEGIEWDWETFPEYLDALERRKLAIDVGTQVPHGVVRAYVMGERGPAHEVATPAEIAGMAQVVRDAIAAGALGFTTSRTEKHKDSSGVLTPSITAHEDELVGIASVLGELDAGVLQGISDFYDFDTEFEMFRRMTEVSGRPCSITVEQQDARPEWWVQLLEGVTQAQADGLPMRGQVPPRATGVLLGLTATLHSFSFFPSYKELHHLSRDEKVTAMRTRRFVRNCCRRPRDSAMDWWARSSPASIKCSASVTRRTMSPAPTSLSQPLRPPEAVAPKRLPTMPCSKRTARPSSITRCSTTWVATCLT